MDDILAHQVMAIIEAGATRPDIDRAQLLLAWGYPERDWSALAALPIGQRDTLLLAVRRKVFGSAIKLSCQCPKCSARFQFDTDIAEISSVAVAEDVCGEPLIVSIGRFEVMLRPLNARDMALLPVQLNDEEAMRYLACRSIQDVRDENGKSIPVPSVAKISKKWLSSISKQLNEQDPLSVIAFSLECVDCGHKWRAFFDAVHLLWRELELENNALLDEIHLLARSYGWREADIIAMPHMRRRAYARKLTEVKKDGLF